MQPTLTEGPFGFPLTDRPAIALDTILKALPKNDAFKYRKCVITKAASEVLPGDRTDVSWISTETVDRVGDVVMARGMNDSQFKLNPIVTLEHCYHLAPVGKSLWRKVVKDGDRMGVKAKTHYPPRPSDWPADKDWPTDIAFTLVQPVASAVMQIPYLDITTAQAAGVSAFYGGMQAAWTAEAQTRTEYEPQFKQLELRPWELVA